jgi:hypothetical protein
MSKSVFYFATLGSGVSINPSHVAEVGKNQESCNDPVSYGLWWAWKKFNAVPKTVVFCTEGEGGSISNFNQIRKKFDRQELIGSEILDPYSFRINVKIIERVLNATVEKITRENHADYYIIINPTSGTNPMAASLFQVALAQAARTDTRRWKLLYVQEFKGTKTKEKAEFNDMEPHEIGMSSLSDNTILALAYEKIMEAEFAVAYKLLTSVAIDDPIVRARKECFETLAKGMMYWDQFNHRKAHDDLKVCLRQAEKYNHLLNSKEKHLIDFCRKKVQVLEAAGSLDEISFFHVADLLANAERRIEKKQSLDGIIRLFRSIELFFEFLLTRNGFSVQKPDFSKFSEKEKNVINENYKKLIANEESLMNTTKTDLFAGGRVYLKEMVPLLEFYNDEGYNEFRKLVSMGNVFRLAQARNTSFLTHGLNAVLDNSNIVNGAKQTIKILKPFFEQIYKKSVSVDGKNQYHEHKLFENLKLTP